MRYIPSPDLPPAIRQEFQRLADQLRTIDVEAIQLAPLHAEPAKYTDGMVVYADGSDWDPGSGEGIYARYNSAWNKL